LTPCGIDFLEDGHKVSVNDGSAERRKPIFVFIPGTYGYSSDSTTQRQHMLCSVKRKLLRNRGQVRTTRLQSNSTHAQRQRKTIHSSMNPQPIALVRSASHACFCHHHHYIIIVNVFYVELTDQSLKKLL